MATLVNVFFIAVLDKDIVWPSPTGSRLLADRLVDLSHIVSGHFLEIAPRCVKLLCSPNISANLFLLFALLSVITFRPVLPALGKFGCVCDHVTAVCSLDEDSVGLVLNLLKTVCFLCPGVIVLIHAQLLLNFL